jgi:hypothetical protein
LRSSSNSIHHHRQRRHYYRQPQPEDQRHHPKVTCMLPVAAPCPFACHILHRHRHRHRHHFRHTHHHQQRQPTIASTNLGASANAPFVSKSIASAFKTRPTVDSIANVPIARTFPTRIFRRAVHPPHLQ